MMKLVALTRITDAVQRWRVAAGPKADPLDFAPHLLRIQEKPPVPLES